MTTLNTVNQETFANSDVTSTYNRAAKIAHKIQSRSVMNLAWKIAKNSAKANNSDPVLVLKNGLLKSTDFFNKITLTLAWQQVKTGNEVLTMKSVPKKVMPRIKEAVTAFLSTGVKIHSELERFALAKVVSVARYGAVDDDLLSAWQNVNQKELELDLAC